MGDEGVVDQRLLPAHRLWSPHQVDCEKNSPVRSPRPPKESLVGQGGSNLYRPFHRPLPGVRNVLLDGAPEEVLRLPLLLPVLLGVPIHAFPILIRFRRRDVSVDDVMAVRGKIGINEGGHG